MFNNFVFADSSKYEIVDLGLQESDSSEALAINDRGHVAGVYWFLGNKQYFIWDEGIGVMLLDLPETATIKVLNNAGQIAGDYKSQDGACHGFFWDACYGLIDIGTLGGRETTVADMNDLGQLVGSSDTSSNTPSGRSEKHAYLWQCGCMQDLGVLSGDLGLPGNTSMATGINNCGQVIGNSNYHLVHKSKLIPTGQKAVIWTNGIIEEFAPLFDGELRLYSINDKGLITSYNSNGVSRHSVFDIGPRHLWHLLVGASETTKINELGNILSQTNISFMGSLPGGDINNKSVVVRNWLDLRIVFNEIKQTPWKELAKVNDFNNKNWIVGSGTNIYGETHAVVLRPID